MLHLQVGTLNLDIKSGDLVIGNVSLKDVTLVPGDNTFPMRGTLDLRAVIGNITDIITAEASSIKGGNLTLNAVTTSVVWNGTKVPYYTDILNTLTLTTTVQIGEILRNTLRYLKSNSNFTSSLSSIKEDLNESSLASRSVERSHKRDPVNLVSYMKHDSYVRDLFRDVEPHKRSAMIEMIEMLSHI